MQTEDDNHKRCNRCDVIKHKDEFHRHPTQRLNRQPTCKACISSDRARAQRQSERARAERRADPDKVRDRYLRKTYGISLADFRHMEAIQEGCCAICKTPTDDLHVDHHHPGGPVRALLCGKCNRGLGLFDEDPDLLRAAAAYVETFCESAPCYLEDMPWNEVSA
jgi:hypothetical protein